MTNDARKTSQLPITTSLSANDRLVVLTNPATSAQTQTVTIRTLSNTIVRANTTTFGTVKVGENLSVDINGFLNANSGSDAVYPITYVRNNTQYTVANTDVLVFVDPNSVDANVRIILPITNVANGQEFFIKNLDPGANHIVKVTTQPGIDSGANYVEDHVDGRFKVNIDLGVKGESHTWIWDGSVYRHVAQNNPEPVFYSSTNSYHQVTIVNPSYANNASADWVAYNNEGDYKTGDGPFVDMGINSNNYNDTTYGNVWGPSDAYLYNYGGNLIVGPETNHSIKFIAGNTNAADVKFVINTTAVFVNTDVVPLADNTFSLGNSSHQWKSLYVTGNTIFINSVALGVDANNNLSIGNNIVVTNNYFADFSSNVIPTTNTTYNIGSVSKQWNELYTKTVSTNSISVNVISSNVISSIEILSNTIFANLTTSNNISSNTIESNLVNSNVVKTNNIILHNKVFDDLHRPVLKVNALDINADGGTTSSVFGPSDTVFDGGAGTSVFGQYEAALDGGVSFNNRHSATFIDGGGAANQF